MIQFIRDIILTSKPLRNLHRSDSGTAMTEFAITLPVYVMFMVGIISMYEIHQGALISEQRAASELWDEALDVQLRNYIPEGEALPISGAGQAVNYYSQADDMDTLAFPLDTVTSAGGMYADSGTKAGFADAIDPNAMNMEDLDCPDAPGLSINQVVNSQTHTARLMNDQPNLSSFSGDTGPVMAAIGAILDGSGSRPMLGAGIRYGVVGGIDTTTWESGDNVQNRGYQAESLARYNASAPTRPMERIFQLALVRFEIGSESAYEDTIAFGTSNTGSGIDSVNPCP